MAGCGGACGQHLGRPGPAISLGLDRRHRRPGNTAGTVGLVNSGLITTAGDGAIGVMAQSIGGGGGNGGDSTAASYSGGTKGSIAISLAVAVGGAAVPAARVVHVTITNKGWWRPLARTPFGVFAQSVGGGGAGGAGGASASARMRRAASGRRWRSEAGAARAVMRALSA
jgi:hypothetical protein